MSKEIEKTIDMMLEAEEFVPYCPKCGKKDKVKRTRLLTPPEGYDAWMCDRCSLAFPVSSD